MALYDNLDRLRAERLLDGIQATAYPHLEQRARSSWLRSTQRRLQRPALPHVAAGPAGPSRPALFTVEGRPVDKVGLTRWLAHTFGAGA
jgi:hypothetical protein